MKPITQAWPAAIAITVALAAPAFAQSHQESRAAEARADRARNGDQARNDDARGQSRARAGSPRATAGYPSQNRAVVRGRQPAAPVVRGDRAVPRAEIYGSRAYATPRAYGYYGRPSNGYYGRPYYVGLPVVRYAHPYYTFRPRFLIGLGVYIGYPVPYPVAYGYPRYVYGYPYGGYPNGGYPPSGAYGGISFDVAPDDSAVWVDGQYVGVARDFSPWYQPLTLTPGRHRIELQAPGRPPLMFDVNIMPGEVLPYRGAL